MAVRVTGGPGKKITAAFIIFRKKADKPLSGSEAGRCMKRYSLQAHIVASLIPLQSSGPKGASLENIDVYAHNCQT